MIKDIEYYKVLVRILVRQFIEAYMCKQIYSNVVVSSLLTLCCRFLA